MRETGGGARPGLGPSSARGGVRHRLVLCDTRALSGTVKRRMGGADAVYFLVSVGFVGSGTPRGATLGPKVQFKVGPLSEGK